MREERGTIPGDAVIYEPFTLWGAAMGNVTVIEGGKFYLRGVIHGNLTVEKGGRVHVLGTVSGHLTVHPDTKVILEGTIGKDATNLGGRLYVEPKANVLGKIITKDGKTKFNKPIKPDYPEL
jgi:cytoskeletal protein CcmA (bactofilin family)